MESFFERVLVSCPLILQTGKWEKLFYWEKPPKSVTREPGIKDPVLFVIGTPKVLVE